MNSFRILRGALPIYLVITVTSASALKSCAVEENDDAKLKADISRLLPDLADSTSSETTDYAIKTLAEIGKANGAKAVSVVAEWLYVDDIKMSTGAAHALGVLGRTQKTALPLLKNVLLHHKESSVKKAAVEALAYVGPDAAEAVPELLEVYKTEKELSLHVAETIRLIGKDCIPMLLKAIRDGDRRVRNFCRASFALMDIKDTESVKVGPDAKSAVPALIQMLSDKDERLPVYGMDKNEDSKVCMSIIRLLSLIGPEAADSLPAIKKSYLQSEYKPLRNEAAKAIDRIENPKKQ